MTTPRAAAPLLFASLLACRSGVEQYVCTRDTQCQDGAETGICEAGGICSFVDGACPSGRRYGNAAGVLTNHCVEYPDASTEALNWFDTNFRQRLRFTISSPVAEALNAFPVLVQLREPQFSHETIVALSSMRLVHDEQVVPVQFEIADQDRGLEVGFWFKATIPATGELEYFIYFDAKEELAAPEEGAIWSSYSAVYHMNRRSQLLPDSSPENNEAKLFQGDTVIGRVGNALGSESLGATATVADSVSLQPTQCLTLSAWVRPSQSDSQAREIVNKSATPSTSGGFRLRYQDRTLGSPSASIALEGGIELSVPAQEVPPLPAGDWSWLGFRVDTNLQMYIDGVAIGAPVPRSAPIASRNEDLMRIGDALLGDLDDLRISLECHSDAWLRAEYLSVHEPLPVLGSPESF